MIELSGTLMLEDRTVATIQNGDIAVCHPQLAPLYIVRTQDLEGWLAARAIDGHRTNARLLKKVFRIRRSDDVQAALAVNAANLTDRYWIRPEGSALSYEDIRFKENPFAGLALRGDPNGFSLSPSRTPELTNTGSFEKCWRLIDCVWWMYKSGNANEYFSELFICRLGEKLGFDMAHYEMDENHIRSRNFTTGLNVNFEPMSALMDDNEDYSDCFDRLYSISPALAEQYLRIVWMDTVCYNMDRHTENFGVLRDVQSGEILSLAPNYDNNIALISRGYLQSPDRAGDGIIRFFREFFRQNETAFGMCRAMEWPEITETLIGDCLRDIEIEADRDYVTKFVLSGQRQVQDILSSGPVIRKITPGGPSEPAL